MLIGVDPGASGVDAWLNAALLEPSSRAEARELGSRFYCTGKPCVAGHIAARWTNNGHCTACCAARNAANSGQERERSRVRRQENPDAAREASLRWRLKHLDAAREADRAAARRARAADPDKFRLANKRWRAANKELCRQMKKAWRKANPDTARASNRNRRALQRQAEGSHTATDIKRIFSDQRGRCGYCRKPIKSRYHVDHIVPLSRGGSNWPKNIQLLCAPCNMQKHTADAIIFAQEKGMLL